MYHGIKLPSFMWTPQFIHKEGNDQREKCEPHISRRICDNINECEKTFEIVEKLI